MPNIGVVFFALGSDVVNVDCLTVENGSSDCGTTPDRSGLSDRKGDGDTPVACHFPHKVALDAIDLSIMGVT